jgi:hypothetical protein
MAAAAANAQVYPGVAGLQAFLTTVGGRFYFAYGRSMRAFHRAFHIDSGIIIIGQKVRLKANLLRGLHVKNTCLAWRRFRRDGIMRAHFQRRLAT